MKSFLYFSSAKVRKIIKRILIMKRFTLSLLACSLGMLTHFRGNNLFDLLTYKIERLDDYDNYHLPTCVPKLQTGSDHDSEYGDIH